MKKGDATVKGLRNTALNYGFFFFLYIYHVRVYSVRVYGPGIEPSGPSVGAKTNFTVETFSAGKGKVDVVVENPKGKAEPVRIDRFEGFPISSRAKENEGYTTFENIVFDYRSITIDKYWKLYFFFTKWPPCLLFDVTFVFRPISPEIVHPFPNPNHSPYPT